MAWTKEDTEALRTGHTGRHDWERAADHIEELERQLVEAHALTFSLGSKLDKAVERIAGLESERKSLESEVLSHRKRLDEFREALERLQTEREEGVRCYALGVEDGRRLEREAIVEWLRKAADIEKHLGDARFGVPRDIHDARCVLLVGLIGEIERGECLK